MSGKILIVDDEDLIRWSLCADLANAGYKTVGAATVAEAVEALADECPDAVLTDLRLGSASGIDVLKATRRDRPGIPVILMTAFADFASAVEALREGAADYISKPLQLAGLKITLQRVLESATMRSRLANAQEKRRGRYSLDTIVCASPSMREAVELARKIAASPHGTVLLLGESGCGKDRLARAIHFASPRGEQPLQEVSCTAIPENLLESELFGHEKGAFTGAVQRKPGLFELAEGGTVFLNEIGHMPLGLQGKILRFLEDKTFKRVGGQDDITVDVRVVAATNANLEDAVTKGNFRSDLYYRLNVLTIRLKPLRERREDIAPLVQRLGERLSRELNRPALSLPAAVLSEMETYDWPGNVRELRNVLERMLILGEREFRPQPVPRRAEDGEGPCAVLPAGGIRLESVEKDLVEQALRRSGGSRQRAAELLRLSPDALRRRIEKFGLRVAAAAAALFIAGRAGAFPFGGKPKDAAGDPFREANAQAAKELEGKAGAHAPAREGTCSKCHADPKRPSALTQEPKALCLSCHPARAEDLGKPNVHAPFKDSDCSTCHRPHASDAPRLLNAAVKDLCGSCHDAKDAALVKAHFGISALEGSCAGCHSPHGSARPKLIREGTEHPPFGERSCDACHEATGKDGKAKLKESPGASCFVCHPDLRERSEAAGAHAPFAGGDCAACHNPHVSSQPDLRREALPGLCLGCHDAALKDAHPVAAHPTSRGGKEDPRRPGKPFDCASCHEPHAGKHGKLLRVDANVLCGECHRN